MKAYNSKTMEQLRKLGSELKGIEVGLDIAMKLDDNKLFTTFYDMYQPLKQKWEKVANCGYINVEIEEYQKNICKFFELDVKAKEEYESEREARKSGMTPDQWKAELELESFMINPNKRCMFCKHFKETDGFPGEHLTNCSAPGNEHIINVDFNESEI